jgi:hypothetical protein
MTEISVKARKAGIGTLFSVLLPGGEFFVLPDLAQLHTECAKYRPYRLDIEPVGDSVSFDV